jgi:hypothetical protein
LARLSLGRDVLLGDEKIPKNTNNKITTTQSLH